MLLFNFLIPLMIISLTYYKKNPCCPQTCLVSNLRFTCLIINNCIIVINVKMPHFYTLFGFYGLSYTRYHGCTILHTSHVYSPMIIYYLAIHNRVHQTRLMYSMDHLLTNHLYVLYENENFYQVHHQFI